MASIYGWLEDKWIQNVDQKAIKNPEESINSTGQDGWISMVLQGIKQGGADNSYFIQRGTSC